MAVSPADGEPVGSPSRRRFPGTPFLAVLALVTVVCLGLLTFVYVDGTDSSSSAGERLRSLVPGSDSAASAAQEEAATRETVIAQAEQFVLRINTYGPGDLDKQNAMPGFADRVHEVITPKFAADFDQSGLMLAEQSVAQTGYARAAKVVAVGVESLDVDRAVVLAAGQISGTYPDPQKPKERLVQEPVQFRFSIALVKTGDDWLVDDFTPVTGDPEKPSTTSPELPTQAPTTEAPTTEAPSSPAPSKRGRR